MKTDSATARLICLFLVYFLFICLKSFQKHISVNLSFLVEDINFNFTIKVHSIVFYFDLSPRSIRGKRGKCLLVKMFKPQSNLVLKQNQRYVFLFLLFDVRIIAFCCSCGANVKICCRMWDHIQFVCLIWLPDAVLGFARLT